jgi:hypothetical protein
MWKQISQIEVRTQSKGVGEQGAEKNVWTCKGGGNMRLKNCIMRSLMTCTAHKVLLGCIIKECEAGKACRKHRKK